MGSFHAGCDVVLPLVGEVTVARARLYFEQRQSADELICTRVSVGALVLAHSVFIHVDTV
jgi:hypothetical protein